MDSHVNFFGLEPPDTIAAAGPNHVVEMVNLAIRVYDKSGNILSTQSLSNFFSSLSPANQSDPFVMFDDSVVNSSGLAGRFIVGVLDFTSTSSPNFLDLAVSNNADPTQGFSEMHKISVGEGAFFADYPREGFNADAYVISFNMFNSSGFFDHVQELTIQKSSVIDQNNATLTTFHADRTNGLFTLTPTVMHGSTTGDPMWFVTESLNADQIDVVKMTNLLSNTPTFQDTDIPVTAYGQPPNAPQPGGSNLIATNDTRILNAALRNNILVADQTVGTGGAAHARWYQFSISSTPTLSQSGEVNPGSGIYTYFPAIDIDANNDLGMTFMQSSSTQFMSMYVTGRVPTDPAGTMDPEVLAVAGQANYSGSRAGDYSGITVDPSTGTSFWAASEYAPSTAFWGTYIANFNVAQSAGTKTWTGGGTTTNWSDPNNWIGGVAPSPGDSLVFGSSAADFTSTNDFVAGTQFGSVTITGSGYAISGNDIVLGGNLDGSAATGSNSVNLNITLSAAESFLASSGSTDLTLGGTINNGGFLLTIGGGNGLLDLTNVVSGSGGLTDANTGTTTLSGTGNTYTGLTNVQSGTLVLNKSSGNAVQGNLTISSATVRLSVNNQIADASAVTIKSAGLLDTNNNSDTIGSLTLTSSSVTTETGTLALGGNVTDTGASTISGNLALGAATRTFTVTTSATLTVSAVVTGSVGLTVNGSGTLVLSSSNSYGGGTILSSATLGLGNSGALGSGALTLNSGTLRADSSAASVSNPVTLAGNVALGGSLGLTLTGLITLTGNRTLTVSNTGTTTFAGVIGQSSTGFGFTKAGAGVLVLSNSNTYSGATTLSAGTLALGKNNALGSGTLAFNGGTLRADGAAVALVNALTLGGGYLTIGGNFNLTFNGSAILTGNRTLAVTTTATTTFAGAIGQSSSGFGLTKAGAGVLVLSNGNTYSGATTLVAGTLALGNNNALGTGTLTLNGGTLRADGAAMALANALTLGGNTTIGGSFDMTFNGLATLTGTRTLTVANTGTTTFAGPIGQSSAGFGLTKAGAGRLVLSNSNTYSGNTTLSAGTLSLGNNNAIGIGTLILNGGTLQAGGAAVTLANPVTLGANVTFAGGFDLTFNGAATLTGNRTLTVSNTGATTFAGPIGESVSGKTLTKAGAGTLLLAASNTYTGATTVSAGTLLVSGSITSAVTVNTGGTLGGSGATGAATVKSGGTLMPGSSASQTAILSVGSMTMNSGSTFSVAVNGTTPGVGGYDQVIASSTVSLGSSTLNMSVGYAAMVGDSYTIIENNSGSAVVGTFNGLAEGAPVVINNMTFQITYKGGASGHDVVITRIS